MPGLDLTFAELGSSEEEILAFANTQGWLGLEVNTEPHSALPLIGGRREPSELQKDRLRAVAQMRLACEVFKAIERKDRGALRQ